MVYEGRPSRGCHTCRARKVKCDEAKPTCRRCSKANRICTGYRDFSTSIEPQQSTPHSGQKRAKPVDIAPALGTACNSLVTRQMGLLQAASPKEVWGLGPQLLSCAASPSHVLHDLALGQLYVKLCKLPQIGSIAGGGLACLPRLIPTLQQGSPLLPALLAVALSIVTQRTSQTEQAAVAVAVSNYHKALQTIREMMSVQIPVPRRNEVLLTIMLLSMYEGITNNDSAVDAWNAHVQGAVAFMRTQNLTTFEDEISKKLIFALLMHASFSWIGSGHEITFNLSEIRSIQKAFVRTPESTPLCSLQWFTCELIALNLQLRDFENSSPIEGYDLSDALTLLDTIRNLRRDLVGCPNELGPEARYTLASVPPNPDVYSTIVYCYASYPVSNYWGHFYALRMFANGLFFRAQRLIPPELYDSSAEIEMVKEENIAIASDICAWAPYTLGYRLPGEETTTYPGKGYPFGQHARTVACYNMLWPLYVAGISEGICSTQREWIATRFDYMYTELGMHKARPLAKRVQEALLMDLEPVQ